MRIFGVVLALMFSASAFGYMTPSTTLTNSQQDSCHRQVSGCPSYVAAYQGRDQGTNVAWSFDDDVEYYSSSCWDMIDTSTYECASYEDTSADNDLTYTALKGYIGNSLNSGVSKSNRTEAHLAAFCSINSSADCSSACLHSDSDCKNDAITYYGCSCL